MYINPLWLDFDKHTKALGLSGWYSDVSDTVDNHIDAICIERGISSIPVDQNGYIDSPFLRSIAVDYAVFTMLVGNWGVVDTDAGIYQDKAQYHWGQYDKNVKNLCPSLV